MPTRATSLMSTTPQERRLKTATEHTWRLVKKRVPDFMISLPAWLKVVITLLASERVALFCLLVYARMHACMCVCA